MAPPPVQLGLIRTLPGRLFVLSFILLIVLGGVQQVTVLPDIVEIFRKVVSLAFIVAMFWLGGLVLARNRRKLLWRVRRKLILSYVFLGFVPVVLVVAFALAGGEVLYTNVVAYLFHEGFGDVVDQVGEMADTAVTEIARQPALAQTVIDRKYANLVGRYPELSFAVVPVHRAAGSAVSVPTAGAWQHVRAPVAVPSWVVASHGFKGALALTGSGAETGEWLLIRAAAPTVDGSAMIIADLPVSVNIVSRLYDKTGIEIVAISVSAVDGGPRPLVGTLPTVPRTAAAPPAPGGMFSLFRQTVAFMDFTDWGTGQSGRIAVRLDAPLGQLYGRMAAVETARLAPTVGGGWDIFLKWLVFLGVLFTIIQGSALVIGWFLARSITYAVHALFVGTERVRQGDFAHRISIESRDQLGDLADSFNRMSASMEHLLHVQREKQRLDDELRIAREIQKSLLPVRPPRMAGLSVADLCEPAREVGGDYYDFFDLGPRQLGVLIADVSGKGTSAALYMAELKGLMLALSHTESSPRRLLINVNHLLADHLDNRSFITMTYAVIDLEARTLTCARAGHTPLIVVSGGRSEVIVPNGMVLGLRLPGAAERFEMLLEEHTRPIQTGDVIVLYTDGITEAMDLDGELFGDATLASVLSTHQALDAAGIRERVLREVKAFVGDAEPHDDMTMVVLKIDDDRVGG
jgi:sigma-B regulation protein RsbU (phosphoserine phosphatase)